MELLYSEYFPVIVDQQAFDEYVFLVEKLRTMEFSSDEYFERHHVVCYCYLPKEWSNKKKNCKENLIRIPARYHFRLHKLLRKAFNDYSMTDALYRMCCSKQNGYKEWMTEEEYEQLRKDYSKQVSNFFKGKIAVHKEGDSKQFRLIDPEDLSFYLEQGYETGMSNGFRKKLSESHKGYKAPKEQREKQGKAVRGGIWIYKILESGEMKRRRLKEGESIPEGWSQGMAQGRRFIHKIIENGVIKRRFIPKEEPLPEGWKEGKCYVPNPDSLKRTHDSTKGRIQVTDGNKVYRIPLNEIDKFIDKGFWITNKKKRIQYNKNKENKNEMKRILVSHIDLDGLGSVLIYLYFKEKRVIPGMDFDTYMLIDYGWEREPNNISYLASFDEVIMADISAPKEYIDKIRAKGTKVRIFDHHLASEWLKDDPDSIWNNTRSGTRIFWEEYARPLVRRYPRVIQELVDRVDTYDCWREDSPLWGEAKALNSVLYGMKDYKAGNEIDSDKDFIESTLRKFNLYPNEWVWMPREKRIIAESIRRENELYEQAKSTMKIRIDSKERLFGLITLGSKISLICSRILKENDGLDYIICINSYHGINGKLSFRTRKDLDLNTFAGVHGHAAAAGAQVTPETANKLWEEDYVPVYLDELAEALKPEDMAPFRFFDQDAHLPF